MHVGQKVTNFVDVLATKFDLVDFKNLIAFVEQSTGLSSSASNNPADIDGLAVVLDRGTQRLVGLFDANNLMNETTKIV